MLLYHVKPRDMRGTELKPLVTLQADAPDLYKEYRKKYRGRSQILQKRIPELGCQWTDVVFLSPIHPRAIRQAYEEADVRFWERLECFQIDSSVLDADRAIMWAQRPENLRGEFWTFVPAGLDLYQSVPAETLEYLREAKKAGLRKPLRYLYTPHVLYQGVIDVTSATVVNSD